jgi:hypothetical protein
MKHWSIAGTLLVLLAPVAAFAGNNTIRESQ